LRFFEYHGSGDITNGGRGGGDNAVAVGGTDDD